MRAIILLIGNELFGLKPDKNGQLLCQKCAGAGIEVVEIRMIPDEVAAILRALESCVSYCELVFISGGLGPTVDDVTRDALREFFAPCAEAYYLPAVARMRAYKQAKNAKLNPEELRQALIFSSAQHIFDNPVGGAPAMSFQHRGIFWISLPGVPIEFASIIENVVFPYLRQNYHLKEGGGELSQSLLVDGISEADLSDLVADLYAQSPAAINWAYLPDSGLTQLRLSCRQSQFAPQLNSLFQQLKLRVQPYMVADKPVDFFAYSKAYLRQHKLTLALAESCTGGALAAIFTAEPGASEFFSYSAVVYQNQMKRQILGLELEEQANAVSAEVVQAMLTGVLAQSAADLGIAVSGYLNLPEHSSLRREVWLAIGTRQVQHCHHEVLAFDDRQANRSYILQRIAYRLYSFLQSLS